MQELIARVEAEALDDTALARLACAGLLSAELVALGDEVVGHFVDTARRQGCSWAQIGSALGVTRQGAQQRHGGIWSGFGKGRGLRTSAIARFGPDARRAVVEAQNTARALGSDHVGAEHLLIGVLGSAPDAAVARLLAESGLSREVVEQAIVLPAGDGFTSPSGRLPFAPAVKKALELAMREAVAHGDRHIGSGHLLLAMLEEQRGVAAQLLVHHGVGRDRVLAALEPNGSATDA